MKKLHTLVAVVGIAGASAAAYWWQNTAPARAQAAGSVSASSSAPGTGPAGAAGKPAGPAGGNGPVAVEVGRVEGLTLNDEVTAVGSLRSHQGVMLRPEVSGRIARLGFADGARVKRGQVLVQLDDTLQRAQLQQSVAQAGIARTNLQRNRELLAQGFVSQSAVDQSAANLQVAEAQVALSQAQLTRMRITAPFDGIAGIRTVNVGDYVRDGADLVAVEDVSTMVVDMRLPESTLPRLRIGLPVDVQLDAVPGKRLSAKVEAIDATLDANGRSLLVRARMDNAEGQLRPGLFARAKLVFATRDNAAVVPEEALVPHGGKQYVVKVVDAGDASGAAKKSQRLEARVGLRLPGKVEILDGLKPGDTVVTAGHGRLMRPEGLPVRVVDVGRAGAPARAPASAASAASGRSPSAPAAV